MSGQEPEWPTCEECVYFCEFNCRRYAPRPITDRRVWIANKRVADMQRRVQRKMPDGTMRGEWAYVYPVNDYLFPDVDGEKDACGEWVSFDGESFLDRVRAIRAGAEA